MSVKCILSSEELEITDYKKKMLVGNMIMDMSKDMAYDKILYDMYDGGVVTVLTGKTHYSGTIRDIEFIKEGSSKGKIGLKIETVMASGKTRRYTYVIDGRTARGTTSTGKNIRIPAIEMAGPIVNYHFNGTVVNGYDSSKVMAVVRRGNEPGQAEINAEKRNISTVINESNIEDLGKIYNSLDGVHPETKKIIDDLTKVGKKVFDKFSINMYENEYRNKGEMIYDKGMDSNTSREVRLSFRPGEPIVGEMPQAEVYAHELIHMSIEGVIQLAKAGVALADNILTKMEKIREFAATNIKEQDFVDAIVDQYADEIAKVEAKLGVVQKDIYVGKLIEFAKVRYKYIFNGNISEFVTHGTTHPLIIKMLQKLDYKDIYKKPESWQKSTIWANLMHLLKTAIEYMYKIVGSDKAYGDKNAQDVVVMMTKQLWKINKLHNRNDGPLERLIVIADQRVKWANVNGNKLIFKIGNITKDSIFGAMKATVALKYAMDPSRGDFTENMTYLDRVYKSYKVVSPGVKWMASDLRNNKWLHENKDTVYGKILTGIVGWTAPESFIPYTWDYLISGFNNGRDAAERFATMGTQSDENREANIKGEASKILDAFKDASAETLNMATKMFFQTNMTLLWSTYGGGEKISKMIQDDDEMNNEISKKVNELKEALSGSITKDENKMWNYITFQLEGMANRMHNGATDSAIVEDGRELALFKDMVSRGMITASAARIIPNVAQLVDEIVALKTIAKKGPKEKIDMIEIIDKYSDGLTAVAISAGMSEMINNQLEKDHNSRVYRVGEVKELTMMNHIIAPDSKDSIKKLDDHGWKYVGKSNVDGYGLYISYLNGEQASFKKQAFAKINIGRNRKKHDVSVKINKKKVRENRHKKLADVMNGKKIEISDYDGYDMISGTPTISYNRQRYEEAVKQDLNIANVLSKMIGENKERLASIDRNNAVYNDVEQRMKGYESGSGDTKLKLRKKYSYKNMAKNHKDEINEFAKKHDMTYLEAMQEVRWKVMIEDGTGLNQRYGKEEWIEIGPEAMNGLDESGIRLAKILWNNLPAQIKNKIRRKSDGSKFIAIPRKDAYHWVGQRDNGFLDIRAPFMDRSLKYILREARVPLKFWKENKEDRYINFGQSMIVSAQVMGKMLSEMTKRIKFDIVGKMPDVIRDNILSNMLYLVANGMNPIDATAGFARVIAKVHEYRKWKTRILELEMIKNRVIMSKKKRLATEEKFGADEENEISRLKSQMKGSLVNSVYSEFSNITDDIVDPRLDKDTTVDDVLSYIKNTNWGGKISGVVPAGKRKEVEKVVHRGYSEAVAALEKTVSLMPEEHRKKALAFGASAYNTLYLTQESGIGKAMMMMQTYGEFAGKVLYYHHQMREGVTHVRALHTVRHMFTNYNAPRHGFMNYMDKFGFWRFTRYQLGAPKNLLRMAVNNPMGLVTLQFAPISTPVETISMDRDFSYNMMTPLETAKEAWSNVTTPAAVEALFGK